MFSSHFWAPHRSTALIQQPSSHKSRPALFTFHKSGARGQSSAPLRNLEAGWSPTSRFSSRCRCAKDAAAAASEMDASAAAEEMKASSSAGDSEDAALNGDEDGAHAGHVTSDDALGRLLESSEFLRSISKAEDANEALDIISEAAMSLSTHSHGGYKFSLGHARKLISWCMDAGQVDLGLSIFRAMSRVSGTRHEAPGALPSWPSADVDTVQMVVLALCKLLRVADAIDVLEEIQFHGLQISSEVPFGHVVDCPLSVGSPLTVVRPEEGAKLVNCSVTRYRFEVFSGSVKKIASEALNKPNNIFIALGRLTGIWKGRQVQAVHELLVVSPDSSGKTFRFGTESSDVPCQEGDRVTLICAPSQSDAGGILGSGPPGKKPGQPLALSHHKSNTLVQLLEAPASLTASAVPGWVVPAAVVFAGTDAASWFLDPSLPIMIGAGAVSVAGSIAAGNEFLLPRLKQLPLNSVNAERVRQELLAQHKELIAKIVSLLRDSGNDVRTLAKLWQLESKMASVSTSGSYDARIERIAKAKENLASRINGNVELLYGFSKVVKMIEIEVEMDVDVTYAEIAGIGQELQKLAEVEMLQEQMLYQAEAQDEVERILRADS